MPAESLAGPFARCRHIESGEVRERAVVFRDLVRRQATDRNIQAEADGFGDRAGGDALLGNSMIARSGLMLVER